MVLTKVVRGTILSENAAKRAPRCSHTTSCVLALCHSGKEVNFPLFPSSVAFHFYYKQSVRTKQIEIKAIAREYSLAILELASARLHCVHSSFCSYIWAASPAAAVPFVLPRSPPGRLSFVPNPELLTIILLLSGPLIGARYNPRLHYLLTPRVVH